MASSDVNYSFREKAILRSLSEDSRAPVSSIAKDAKCSRITVVKYIRELVRRYDIRFIVEVDEDKLGFNQRHIVIVRFLKKPSLKKLKEIFCNDPLVSNAYYCEGDFGLILHVVTPDPMDYIIWESLLPGKLGDFNVEIYPSELMLTNFGYLPISGELVYRASKNINRMDKEIINALNKDGRASSVKLSKELKINRTTLHYRIFTLFKKGIIKRLTIAVNRPPMDYVIAFAVNYNFNRTSQLRAIKVRKYYQTFDKDMPLLNSFQLLAPMSGSYRFFGIGIFQNKEEAVEFAIKSHKEIYSEENIQIKYARVTGLVKGLYPFRNLDMIEHYRKFEWDKNR